MNFEWTSLVYTVVHFLMLFSYEKCIIASTLNGKETSANYSCTQMLVAIVSGFVHDLGLVNSTYIPGFYVV